MTTTPPNKPTQDIDKNLLAHDYDGIQELDNPLPRWWVHLFCGTIVFAIAYCIYFWIGPGLSVKDQFEKDMVKYAPKKEQTTPLVTNDIPSGEEWVERGKVIFISKCVSCHGQNGEGFIGPNLTDNHWISGDGSLAAIFTVIKKGVPAKGMIAWETMLKQDELVAAANYVKSLKGTNPPNGKAPEGQEITQ
jgi:cytochrome c oxidase cbb3-type subunit III